MSAEARRSIGAVRNPDSQRAILEAARQILVEEGLSAFSIANPKFSSTYLQAATTKPH